jgi:hypothetical protein
MDVGVTIGRTPRLADPGAVRVAAAAAEQVGYASLWAMDGPPEVCPDPFVVLTLASSVTSRIRLGLLRCEPCCYGTEALERAVRTLASMSDGRLIVASPSEVVLVELEIGDDLREIADGVAGAGVSDIVLAVRGDPSLDETLDAYARLTEALRARR